MVRILAGLLVAVGLSLGVIGCLGPASSPPTPSGPGSSATAPVFPTLPRPTGPSSTIEVPPPID